jgi:tRNA threonylcarbamoyladenosine biosynthesis protein TsaE
VITPVQIINEEAMTRLGAQLAQIILPGSIIYLEGELGTGKTTLVRGFLRALGHSGAIKSPTFTIVEPYSIDKNISYNYNKLDKFVKPDPDDKIVTALKYRHNCTDSDANQQQVYHFDLYRLEDAEELEYLGIRDYLDGEAIALIEWPKKGWGILPQADLTISLQHQKQGRQVDWLAQSKNGENIAFQLASLEKN